MGWRRWFALLVIGPKLSPALPTLRVLLPFHDSVMLAALRTRIARHQLPIFLGFHEAHLRTALWPPSIRATVDPGAELVKPLPLTPVHLFATHLHFGNVFRVYRYANQSVRKAPLFLEIVPLSKRFPVRLHLHGPILLGTAPSRGRRQTLPQQLVLVSSRNSRAP